MSQRAALVRVVPKARFIVPNVKGEQVKIIRVNLNKINMRHTNNILSSQEKS